MALVGDAGFNDTHARYFRVNDLQVVVVAHGQDPPPGLTDELNASEGAQWLADLGIDTTTPTVALDGPVSVAQFAARSVTTRGESVD